MPDTIELRNLPTGIGARINKSGGFGRDMNPDAMIAHNDIGNGNNSDNDNDSTKNTDIYPDGGWKAYSVVLGAHCGLMVHFGILNSVGAVQAYVSAHQLAGESVLVVSWVFSIYLCLPFFLGAIVGPLFDRHGSTWLLACSTALLVVGFVALSFSQSIVAFLFSLSLCLGTAHALAVPPLVSLVGQWFLVHRGKAVGLASLGGSVGGTIWPLVLQALYGSVGFAWAIRIVGAVAVCLLLLSVVLVKLRFKLRPKQAQPEKGEENAQIGSKRLLTAFRRHLDLKPFRDRRFSALVLGVFLTEIALLSVLTYLASYAIAHGFSEKRSLLLLTILNATGIPGRYLLGLCADRYGSINTMVFMLVGFCISILCIWLPLDGRTGMLFAFAALCGFFSSAILSLTPVCLGSFTPVDVFGRCYGLMYTFSSTGILFGVPVGLAIIGNSSVANYRNFTLFCGAFAVAGTLSWLTCRSFIVGFKLNTKV